MPVFFRDTEPTEHISAILCHRLVMSDEVEMVAARLAELVKLSPVLVERSTCSWIDEVLNELSERRWTALFHVLAISPRESVSTKRTSVYVANLQHSIITKTVQNLIFETTTFYS